MNKRRLTYVLVAVSFVLTIVWIVSVKGVKEPEPYKQMFVTVEVMNSGEIHVYDASSKDPIVLVTPIVRDGREEGLKFTVDACDRRVDAIIPPLDGIDLEAQCKRSMR